MTGMHKIKLYFFIGLFFSGIIVLLAGSSDSLASSLPQKNEKKSPSLNLIGVIVSENASSSLAVLEDQSIDEIVIIKVGENVSGLELVQVFKNRIILQNESDSFLIFLKIADPKFLAENKNRNRRNRNSNEKWSSNAASGYQGPPGVHAQGPPGAQLAGPPGQNDYVDLSSNAPGGQGANIQNEKNLTPKETGSIQRSPGPGEPGFQYVEQKNLVPREDPSQKKKQPKKNKS